MSAKARAAGFSELRHEKTAYSDGNEEGGLASGAVASGASIAGILAFELSVLRGSGTDSGAGVGAGVAGGPELVVLVKGAAPELIRR